MDGTRRPQPLATVEVGDDVDPSVSSRFERVVATYPDRLAIASARGSKTYSELNRDVERVAGQIFASIGSDPGRPIAILLDDPVDTIATMLGALRTGHPYVPLDPLGPPSRLRWLIDDSRAHVLVTSTPLLRRAREISDSEIEILAFDPSPPPPMRDTIHHVPPSPNTLAWILYTSGSTGHPKGVVQTHRNISHYVDTYRDGYQITSDDRIAVLYSLTTNAGNHELLSGLLNGACVLPFDVRGEGLTALARWLVSERITIYSSVPTLFRRLAATLDETGQFPDLRVVKMVGEPVYRTDVEAYRRHFGPSCVFINRLGSTETGTIRWHFIDHETVLSDEARVPVGDATPDHEVALLDEAGQTVPAGAIGQICVRSRYLSPGYWNNSDATHRVFLPDPDGGDRRLFLTGDLGKMDRDGLLVHMGRADDQVKVRGYRVELAEIQLTLVALHDVKEAVVVAREHSDGERRLVAYVVPRTPASFSVTDLRRELERHLPDYMIPSVFVPLSSFPLAPNGKINRSALPAPSKGRPGLATPFLAPRTTVERELTDIWCDVLDLSELGTDDPFIELGGDSIGATQVVSRVRERFNVEIPLAQLLEAGTVGAMARVIRRTLTAQP